MIGQSSNGLKKPIERSEFQMCFFPYALRLLSRLEKKTPLDVR